MNAAPITAVEEVTNFEIKEEIVSLLNHDVRFQDKKFDLFKSGDIRFWEDRNLEGAKSLTIYVVVPDGSLPMNEDQAHREQVRKFFKPVIQAILNLETVRRAFISRDYFVVSVYFQEKSLIDQAKEVIKI